MNAATQADTRAQHGLVDWQQACAQMDDQVARQGAPYATGIGPSGHWPRRWRWRVTIPLGQVTTDADTAITAYEGCTFTHEGAEMAVARYNGSLRVGELIGRGLLAVGVAYVFGLMFLAAHLPAVFGSWGFAIVGGLFLAVGVLRIVRGMRVVRSAEDCEWVPPRE